MRALNNTVLARFGRRETLGSAQLSRRRFLSQGLSVLGVVAMSGLSAQVFGASTRLSRVVAYPFTLGVASGDPTSDSVVL